MKTSILISAIVACALSAPIVSAQERVPTPAKPGMQMDMDKQMPQMQDNMKKMQQQMEKIGATTDPKVRQKLMQEHMQTMQENMKTMRGMGGPMMMGSGERGGMGMGGQKGGMGMGGQKGDTAMGGQKSADVTGGDVKARQETMEKRMDMMQMMMEQMIQRDQAAKPMGHM